MGWGADWAVRAALKTSAVLLKYSIYSFFSYFHWQKTNKIVVSALKS